MSLTLTQKKQKEEALRLASEERKEKERFAAMLKQLGIFRQSTKSTKYVYPNTPGKLRRILIQRSRAQSTK